MAGPLGALNYLPFAGGLAGGGGTAPLPEELPAVPA
jgi:hypothetical protein